MTGMPNVSEKASDQLEAWFRKGPTFALMGEYSAGKSTLLNLLLGQSLLPTRVTATQFPAVWLTYGDTRSIVGLTYDGAATDLTDADLISGDLSDFLLLRIALPSDLLKVADVLDTPGISDPRLARGLIEFLSRFSDFAIWCSTASQAWRQSEKAMWSSLPKRLRQNSILAVTRTDKVGKSADLDRIVARCRKEAAPLFREIRPIASVRAMRVIKDLDLTQEARDVWASSGAEALVDAILVSIQQARVDWEARQNDVADRTPGTSSIAPAAPVPVSPSIPHNARSVGELIEAVQNSPTKEQLSAIFDQSSVRFRADKKLSKEHRLVFERIVHAEIPDDVDIARAIFQIEREVSDFSKNPRCRIG